MRMRSILSNPPENEQEGVADLLQWLLLLKPVQKVLGKPVNARYLAQAMADLCQASNAFRGNPYEVRLAWQMLSDVLGPQALWRFVASGAWRHYCPRVSRCHDSQSKFAVWVGQGVKVVARVQFRQEDPVDLRFDVEAI